MYIWLNSPDFLNKTFGFSLTEPILTPFSFQLYSGILILAVTIFLIFCKPETNPPMRSQSWSLRDTLNIMKGFYKNRNLVLLIVYLLTSSITTATIDNLSSIILLKEGLSRQIMSTISFIIIPVQIFSSLYTATLCKK